jgi:hypothetical protein
MVALKEKCLRILLQINSTIWSLVKVIRAIPVLKSESKEKVSVISEPEQSNTGTTVYMINLEQNVPSRQEKKIKRPV